MSSSPSQQSLEERIAQMQDFSASHLKSNPEGRVIINFLIETIRDQMEINTHLQAQIDDNKSEQLKINERLQKDIEAAFIFLKEIMPSVEAVRTSLTEKVGVLSEKTDEMTEGVNSALFQLQAIKAFTLWKIFKKGFIPSLLVTVWWNPADIQSTLYNLFTNKTPIEFITHAWEKVDFSLPQSPEKPFSCIYEDNCANPKFRLNNETLQTLITNSVPKDNSESQFPYGNNTIEFTNNALQYLQVVGKESFMSLNSLYNISSSIPSGHAAPYGSMLFCDASKTNTPNITDMAIVIEQVDSEYTLAYNNASDLQIVSTSTPCPKSEQFHVQTIPHIAYEKTASVLTDEETRSENSSWWSPITIMIKELNEWASSDADEDGTRLDLSKLKDPHAYAEHRGTKNWSYAIGDVEKSDVMSKIVAKMGLTVEEIKSTQIPEEFKNGLYMPNIESEGGKMIKTQYHFDVETVQMLIAITNTFNRSAIAKKTNMNITVEDLLIVAGIESGSFNEKVVNPWKFKGLMQLKTAIPDIAKYYDIDERMLNQNIMNPIVNLLAGLSYSAIMISEYSEGNSFVQVAEQLRDDGKKFPLWTAYMIHQQGLRGFKRVLSRSFPEYPKDPTLFSLLSEHQSIPPLLKGFEGANSESYFTKSMNLLAEEEPLPHAELSIIKDHLKPSHQKNSFYIDHLHPVVQSTIYGTIQEYPDIMVGDTFRSKEMQQGYINKGLQADSPKKSYHTKAEGLASDISRWKMNGEKWTEEELETIKDFININYYRHGVEAILHGKANNRHIHIGFVGYRGTQTMLTRKTMPQKRKTVRIKKNLLLEKEVLHRAF